MRVAAVARPRRWSPRRSRTARGTAAVDLRKADIRPRAGSLAGAVVALALVGCQAKPNTGQSAVENGIRFEYGLAPAAQVAEHPAVHAEGEMHGGPSQAPDAYHVTLALFDAMSGARITDATAAVAVSGPGHPGHVSVSLEPMTVASDVTYGGYVTLPQAASYRLTFSVKRPAGAAGQPVAGGLGQGDVAAVG